jgi:hypothetical protein
MHGLFEIWRKYVWNVLKIKIPNKGSMLWSLFSAIFANFRLKFWRFFKQEQAFLLCGWAKLENHKNAYQIACIIFLNMKILILFMKQYRLLFPPRELHIKQACLLAAQVSYVIACIVFFIWKYLFVLRNKLASLQSFPFFFGGGVIIAFYGWALLNKNQWFFL